MFPRVVLGRFGFYTQVCEQRVRQREPKAGSDPPGASSQRAGPPSVSLKTHSFVKKKKIKKMLFYQMKCVFLFRNVHSRSAGRPTIQLLKEQGVTPSVREELKLLKCLTLKVPLFSIATLNMAVVCISISLLIIIIRRRIKAACAAFRRCGKSSPSRL